MFCIFFLVTPLSILYRLLGSLRLLRSILEKDPIIRAIETFGTARKPRRMIEDFAWGLLDLSVAGIINGLNLRWPIYQKTARYGHFGHKEYPWEKIV